MLFTVVGSLFIILFGLGIAYELLWLDDEENELEGHPIMYNLTGHIVPVVSFDYYYYSFLQKNTASERYSNKMLSSFARVK